MPTQQEILEAAVHRALADLIESGGPACAITVRASGIAWSLVLVASPVSAATAETSPPVARLTPCQQDILSVLSTDTRLTTSQVLKGLAKRGLLHGESTVKAALAKLVDQGTICNSKRAPRGYHLPSQLQLFA